MECDCCKNDWERETKRRKVSDGSYVRSAKAYLPMGSAEILTSVSSTSSTKTCSGILRELLEKIPHNIDNDVATEGLKPQNNRLRSTSKNSPPVETENEYACLPKNGRKQKGRHDQLDENKSHTESTQSESSWECSDADNCEVCLYIKRVHDGLKMKPSCGLSNELRLRVQFKEDMEKKVNSKYQSMSHLALDKKLFHVESPQRYGKTIHYSESMKSLTRNDIDDEECKKHFKIQKNTSKECRDTFVLKIPLPFIKEKNPIPISLHQGLTIYRNYYKKDHPIVQYMTLFDDVSNLENTTQSKTFQKGFVKSREMEINPKESLRAKKDWSNATVNSSLSDTENNLVQKDDKVDKDDPNNYTKVIAVLVKTPTTMVSLKKQKLKNFLKPTISSELKNSCLMRAHLKNKTHLDVRADRCNSSCIRLSKTQEKLYEEATRITNRVMQKYSVRKTTNTSFLKKNDNTLLLPSHSSFGNQTHTKLNDRLEEEIRIIDGCALLEKCLSKFPVSGYTKSDLLVSDSSSHTSYLKKKTARNVSQHDFSNKARYEEFKSCTALLNDIHAHSKVLSEKHIPKDWCIEPKRTEELLLCGENISMQKIHSLNLGEKQQVYKVCLLQMPHTSKIQDVNKKTNGFSGEVKSKHTERHLKLSTSSSPGNQSHSKEVFKKNHPSQILNQIETPVTYYKYRCPALCLKYPKKEPDLGEFSRKNFDHKFLSTSRSTHKNFKTTTPLQRWPLIPKKSTINASKFNNTQSDTLINSLDSSVQLTNFDNGGKVLDNFEKISKCTNIKKTTRFELTDQLCLTRKQKQTDVPSRNMRQENRESLGISRQPFEALKENYQSVQVTGSCDLPPMNACAVEPNVCKKNNALLKNTNVYKAEHATGPVNQKISYSVISNQEQENATITPTLYRSSRDTKKNPIYSTNVSKHTFSTKKGKEEVRSQGHGGFKNRPKKFSAKVSKEKITVSDQPLSHLESQPVVFSEQAYEGQEKKLSYEHPELPLSMKEWRNSSGNPYSSDAKNQKVLNCKEEITMTHSLMKGVNYGDFQFSHCDNMKTPEKMTKYWTPTENTTETCLPIFSKDSFVVEGNTLYSSFHSYKNIANSKEPMAYFVPPGKALPQPYVIPYYPNEISTIPFQIEGNPKIYRAFNKDNNFVKTIPTESNSTMEQIKSILRKTNACYANQMEPSYIDSQKVSFSTKENCSEKKPKTCSSSLIYPETHVFMKYSRKNQPKLLVQRNSPFLSQLNVGKLFPQHLFALKDCFFKHKAQTSPLRGNLSFHEILESSVRPEQQSLNMSMTIQDHPYVARKSLIPFVNS